jgi:hypothetical protein
MANESVDEILGREAFEAYAADLAETGSRQEWDYQSPRVKKAFVAAARATAESVRGAGEEPGSDAPGGGGLRVKAMEIVGRERKELTEGYSRCSPAAEGSYMSRLHELDDMLMGLATGVDQQGAAGARTIHDVHE